MLRRRTSRGDHPLGLPLAAQAQTATASAADLSYCAKLQRHLQRISGPRTRGHINHATSSVVRRTSASKATPPRPIPVLSAF